MAPSTSIEDAEKEMRFIREMLKQSRKLSGEDLETIKKNLRNRIVKLIIDVEPLTRTGSAENQGLAGAILSGAKEVLKNL